jgi:hypothetical protein
MASAPTSELGQTGLSAGMWPGGVAAWAAFNDEQEYVPELVWPGSVAMYDRMRTDSQLAALLAAFTLPIRRYRWTIDPNGARPEIVARIAEDLGLPVRGEEAKPRGRSRGRFAHDSHLRLAFEALVYGHAYFEQVGEIRDGLWRLRKLASRPQWTLAGGQIKVALDGGLVSIRQSVGVEMPEIPVDRLVAYVWDQAPGNWVGRSMLRDCYRNWLIKDRLLRVDAQLHEKAGGIHIPEAPPNATQKEIEALAALSQRLVVGLDAGGAVPSGTRWNRVGTQPADVIASIRYHDESMAARFIQMVMQLGKTEHGARALGDTFVDLASQAQVSAALWYRDTTNEHVIEDWVDWNYGEGEELCPLVTFDPPDDEALSVGDFVAMIEGGAITIDPELEAYVRERYSLPELDPQAAVPTPPAPPAPAPAPAPTAASRRRQEQAKAALGGDLPPIPLPPRTLRRAPSDQEIKASVDFAAMESSFLAARAALVAAWKQVQTSQRGELQGKIAAAGADLAKLSTLELTPSGAEVIQEALARMAAVGATQALNEATRQGVDAQAPDLAKTVASLDARATAIETLLARSYAETASRRAVALSGGSLGPTEVAAGVSDHLAWLSEAYLEEQLGGALLQAQNSGRKAAMEAAGASSYYASELLDANTCDPCSTIDGTEYASLEDAEADYPTGGYADCDGGPRCRGTLVAIYDEAPATV